MKAYEKMTRLFTWFNTSVNSFLMTSWCQALFFKSSLIQHDVHLGNNGPIQSKKDDKAEYALVYDVLPQCVISQIQSGAPPSEKKI